MVHERIHFVIVFIFPKVFVQSRWWSADFNFDFISVQIPVQSFGESFLSHLFLVCMPFSCIQTAATKVSCHLEIASELFRFFFIHSISNSQTESFTLLEIVSNHKQQTPTHRVVQLCACKRHRTNRKTILLKSFAPTTIRFSVFVTALVPWSLIWETPLKHTQMNWKCLPLEINMQMAFGRDGFKWVICSVAKCGTHTHTHTTCQAH